MKRVSRAERRWSRREREEEKLRVRPEWFGLRSTRD
jgi:hypothetical protein